jgi:hypothetical protein
MFESINPDDVAVDVIQAREDPEVGQEALLRRDVGAGGVELGRRSDAGDRHGGARMGAAPKIMAITNGNHFMSTPPRAGLNEREPSWIISRSRSPSNARNDLLVLLAINGATTHRNAGRSVADYRPFLCGE